MAEDEQKKVFAENLRYFLEINGRTQADLARHMGVSTTSTAKWANGLAIPRMDKIQAICNWLGIKKSDLLEPRSENTPYYDTAAARDFAEFLYNNPEYSVLFDAARNVKPEDIEFVRQFIERMGGKD